MATKKRSSIIDDPSVPDYVIITRSQLMQELSYNSRSTMDRAISHGHIPRPMDSGGPRGESRWTVGMIRQWHLEKGIRSLKESLGGSAKSVSSLTQEQIDALAV